MKAHGQQIASVKMEDLDESEKQQIRMNRILKEIAVRKKRRAQGIWYDEETHFGNKVKCNLIREVTFIDKKLNKDLDMMKITIPILSVLAIIVAIVAQWDVFTLKRESMYERQQERVRRMTMPAGNVRGPFDRP